MKQLFLPIILYVCLSPGAAGMTPAEALCNDPVMQNANIGLLVRDAATGEVVAALDANKSFTPASTMKIVTTATALELLGPDFRFETQVQAAGRVDSAGVLHGNLYIRGGGDPTLGSLKVMGGRGFLPYWVNAVKRAGIRAVDGCVVADDGLFDLEGVNPHWSWEDIGNYYAPGIYALSYNDNTTCVHFYSGGIGTKPEVTYTVPELPGVTIHNHLRSSPIGNDSAWFYGAPRSNERHVYGEVPVNCGDYIAKMDIPNPGLLLAQHFHDELLEAGVAVAYPPVSEAHTDTTGRRTLYVHRSMPLQDIVKVINERSNNHYAEHVFRYLALQDEQVATLQGALRVVRRHWAERGLPVEQLYMYDGSGLARADAVSAEFFVALLDYMRTRSTAGEAFFRSLPVAGRSGTLSGVLRGTSLQGRVHAKSGSQTGVRAYAGYIDTEEKSYTFAVIINHYAGKPRAAMRAIEHFLLTCVGQE